MHQYRGAIHIHTKISDGSGSYEDICDKALDAGLDYLIFSDHPSHKKSSNKPSSYYHHSKVLAIIGEEVSAHRENHAIALGLDNFLESETDEPDNHIEKIANLNGFAIAAHPEKTCVPQFIFYTPPWTLWDSPNYQAIELWSIMHDWIEDLTWLNFYPKIRHPERYIRGPRNSLLQKWDELLKTRHITAIGSLDAHGNRTPFIKIKAFSY